MKKQIGKILAVFFTILFALGLFFVVKWMAEISSKSLEGEKPGISGNQKEDKEEIRDYSQLIVVEKPKPAEEIESPLEIKGVARGIWFFEASFPIRLLDGKGNVLASGIASATSDWMTSEFVPFEASLNFNPGDASEGFLVFEKDNPSGLPENDDSFSVPVFFKGGTETTVMVYFGNSRLNPEQLDCGKVYPVERKVERVPKIGQTAIEELLKGPSDQEKEQGYFTSLQEGTALNGLSIQHGVAFIDFNENLDQGVGGSCRVSAIRSQIEKTLMQFPTVKEVQIYVGERSEDVLQP